MLECMTNKKEKNLIILRNVSFFQDKKHDSPEAFMKKKRLQKSNKKWTILKDLEMTWGKMGHQMPKSQEVVFKTHIQMDFHMKIRQISVQYAFGQ